MSLVPILYTSLMIFTVLMAVIVTFSYIAFKVRNKNEEDKETLNSRHNYKINSHLSIQGNTSIVNNNKIKVVSTIRNPELRKTVDLSSNNPTTRKTKQRTFSKVPAAKPRTTVVNSNDESYYKNPNDYQLNARTNKNPNNKRIQVLNDLSKQPQETKSKEHFQTSGAGSIAVPKYMANFQAIKYYADEEESDLQKPTDYYYSPNKFSD